MILFQNLIKAHIPGKCCSVCVEREYIPSIQSLLFTRQTHERLNKNFDFASIFHFQSITFILQLFQPTLVVLFPVPARNSCSTPRSTVNTIPSTVFASTRWPRTLSKTNSPSESNKNTARPAQSASN